MTTVPSPPVPDWITTRLENLAWIEAALARNSEHCLEIMKGDDFATLARGLDAMALAAVVISSLDDPAAAIAELRQQAIAGDL